MPELKLRAIPVTAIQTNCYILHNKTEAVIFDPGGDFDVIDDFLIMNNLTPVLILNTHTHFDHVGAVNSLKTKYGVKFYIHKADEKLLQSSKNSAERYGFEFDGIPEVDSFLEDNQLIEFSGINIQVIHTPGHSAGSVSFLVDNKILISGDTLFFESVGRTDFPYSSQEELIKSITGKIFLLDDNVVVYPGHGRSTTVQHEKAHNPFLDF